MIDRATSRASTSLGAVCAVVLGATALTGCATGHARSLASRFVKPGVPTTDLQGPIPASGHLPAREIDEARRRAPKQSTGWGLRMENTDPGLAAALLLELTLPSAEHQLGVAREYRRLGILDAAYARVTEAIKIEPHLREAHEMLAQIWRDWQMPARALGPAYRATYFDPRSASARNTLGTILERLGRPDAAGRAYEAAAERAPAAAWPLNNLCHLELGRGRLDAARAYCTAALALQPDFAAAHNNLALAFAASGDLERAEEQFLAAGDPAAANYNLGIVYLAHRQYDCAADRFEAAIKARPTFSAAKARAHEARVRARTGSE
jgi:Flp pilus assembly protein TadD